MKTPNSASSLLYILLGTGAVAVVAAGLFYRVHFPGPASTEAAAWGQFGDFFGGTLNPVFAYLSFTALVITLALQTKQLEISSEQLKLSKEELVATRNELQRSADAQAATAAALVRQAEMTALSARVAAVSKALEAADAEIQRWAKPDPANTRYAHYTALLAKRWELEAGLGNILDLIRASAA